MTAASRYAVTLAAPRDRITACLATVLLVACLAAPWWAGSANQRLFGEMFLYLSLATLWNLLAGYVGLVSVGQQAFVGLGGYLLFALALFAGVPPLWAVPVIGVAGAIVAVPVAVLLFRLRGAYFAIGTWVVAEVFRLGFAQVSALGGGSGSSLPATVVKSIAGSRFMREAATYWMALGMACLVLGLAYALLRSRHGLALTAIRDSEAAAASLGVDIWRTKLFVYALVAGLTAMVGALIFLAKIRISPEAAFSVNDWTAFVIFIVVIGGIGTLEGPIIGTLLFFALRETLADLGSIYLLILGAVAIVVMLKAPQGLWGFAKGRFGWQLFPLVSKVTAIPSSPPATESDK